MSSQHPQVVRQLVEQAPPVSPVEALRRNLLYAMFNGVTTDDMTAIVAKQVEQAKDGDGRAAQLIIDMVSAGGEPRGATHMQQAIVVNGREDKRALFQSDLRRNAATLLAAAGPLQTAAIADRLHAPMPQVLDALHDHPWFLHEGGKGWAVTDKGREEVPQVTASALPAKRRRRRPTP